MSALAAGTAAAATGAALPTEATAAAAKRRPRAKTGPVTVAYIEVNDHSMLNAGKYTLANSGAQVIDVAVIFAANINYDGTSAYLHFNDQVTNVLNNVATQVRPLQQKGIKVLLSILGNHQGAGFANFPDQASADAFAQQLADAVNQYGLDGIDFDDEYAEYGNNGTGQPNDFSFVYLVQALRAKLPNKLITLYDIGPAADRLTYNGQSIANTFDYAWNPYYGTYSAPSTPEAQLIGTGGRVHHFGGPSWQSLRDGSLVTAAKKQSNPRTGAIPELLLQVTSHTGSGVLSKADWINRLYTTGGVAPAGPCTAGQTVQIPYGAVYVFWDDPKI